MKVRGSQGVIEGVGLLEFLVDGGTLPLHELEESFWALLGGAQRRGKADA